MHVDRLCCRHGVAVAAHFHLEMCYRGNPCEVDRNREGCAASRCAPCTAVSRPRNPRSVLLPDSTGCRQIRCWIASSSLTPCQALQGSSPWSSPVVAKCALLLPSASDGVAERAPPTRRGQGTFANSSRFTLPNADSQRTDRVCFPTYGRVPESSAAMSRARAISLPVNVLHESAGPPASSVGRSTSE